MELDFVRLNLDPSHAIEEVIRQKTADFRDFLAKEIPATRRNFLRDNTQIRQEATSLVAYLSPEGIRKNESMKIRGFDRFANYRQNVFSSVISRLGERGL